MRSPESYLLAMLRPLSGTITGGPFTLLDYRTETAPDASVGGVMAGTVANDNGVSPGISLSDGSRIIFASLSQHRAMAEIV